MNVRFDLKGLKHLNIVFIKNSILWKSLGGNKYGECCPSEGSKAKTQGPEAPWVFGLLTPQGQHSPFYPLGFSKEYINLVM